MSERKIIDYTVIEDRCKIEFLKDVTFMIKQGWQPYGEPVLPREEKQYTYYTQAIMKYEHI